MKKSYLITTGVGVLLALLTSLATTYYLLIPKIILFFGYGITAYFLVRTFKEVSPWKTFLILAILLIIGQIISAMIVPQFRLYVIINCIYFTIGALAGILFYKGKIAVKIIALIASVILCWYYANLTKVNREFPAPDMMRILEEHPTPPPGWQESQ